MAPQNLTKFSPTSLKIQQNKSCIVKGSDLDDGHYA